VAGALCTVLDEYCFLINLLFGVLRYITPHKTSVLNLNLKYELCQKLREVALT
jgi:hypothetical protein